MLETFTADTFASRLHDQFALEDGGDGLELELVEATELGAATHGRLAPFSLVFRALDGRTVPQRIYRLEHAELGTFELFLVPIGPGEYEAVFT